MDQIADHEQEREERSLHTTQRSPVTLRRANDESGGGRTLTSMVSATPAEKPPAAGQEQGRAGVRRDRSLRLVHQCASSECLPARLSEQDVGV